MAWGRGEEDVDAQAGAYVVAKFVNSVLDALTKKR